MSLRLIWAGPWNERSAIGFFGTEIVRELVGQGHHVEVLRTEVGADLQLPSLPAPGLIHIAGDRLVTELAHKSDGIIVNLGNHYGFHGAAIPILRETAPLVILHDAWMGHFIEGWHQAAGNEAGGVDRLLNELGRDVSGIAPLCALACGVVVHSPHYRAEAEASCPGPVVTMPLSLKYEALPSPQPICDRLVVTTIGHINRNKQANEVIRALGASERLRERVLYILAGPVESAEQMRLLELAHRVGAREPHFTGWIPDEMLRIVMAGTDVFCCLRYPALEGGSASLIASMLSARPALVSDHASYAEIPDKLVLKCIPGQEAAHVMHHLETILDNPTDARMMGERARQYALRHFAPATYAIRLLDALDAAAQVVPAIRAGRGVGKRLAELGVRPSDPALERVDATLTELLWMGEHGLDNEALA